MSNKRKINEGTGMLNFGDIVGRISRKDPELSAIAERLDKARQAKSAGKKTKRGDHAQG